MSIELQSFVVAAIVAAFFLADRIGGQEAVTRRLYQVAVGFALLFLIASFTTAFIRGDGQSFQDILRLPANQQSAALFDNNNGSIARDSASVRAGAGLVLLVAGFWALQRWPTLGLGVALGGLLALFSGGSQSGGFDLSNLSSNALFGAIFGQAEQGSDIAHFVVLLVGSLLLLAYGYRRWEAAPPAAA